MEQADRRRRVVLDVLLPASFHSVTTSSYDGLGELTSTADDLGNTSKYGYDDQGAAVPGPRAGLSSYRWRKR
jgi:hypothetical protein